MGKSKILLKSAYEMKFHRELYVGDSIRNSVLVKWKLKHHAGQLRVFVITLSNGTDQLEILHCAFLQQKFYKKFPPYIVGIACSYGEALELLCRMAEDVYAKTGNCQLKEYFSRD